MVLLGVGKSENLRRERLRRGLGVEEAASGMGVAPELLRGWESDEDEPRASDLRRASTFYGCSPDYLLGMTRQRTWGLVCG